MSGIATFDDLLARKLEREERNDRTYDIAVKGMDRPLRMTHPSAARQLDLMDELRDIDTLPDLAELYVRLIYDCCPLFRLESTQTALGTVDPYDAIRSVFEPLEIIDIGDRFCEACGLIGRTSGDDGDLTARVKN